MTDKLSDPLLESLRVPEIKQMTTDQIWFRDPELEPPPKGTSLLLLNAGGVCVIGTWSDDCLGWCPKPRIPYTIKSKMWKD